MKTLCAVGVMLTLCTAPVRAGDDLEQAVTEDFAYFVLTEDHVPGAHFTVGGMPQADLDAEEADGPPVPSHHSPIFKIDPEPSVTMGVRAMMVAVLELLGTDQ